MSLQGELFKDFGQWHFGQYPVSSRKRKEGDVFDRAPWLNEIYLFALFVANGSGAVK
jgi:hypothetical protein